MKKLTTLAIALTMGVTMSSFYLCNSSVTFANSGQNQGERTTNILRGRDIVTIGKLYSISGVLRQEGEEWVLTNSKGKFNIHLGPIAYRDFKGFSMKVGATAKVIGMFHQNDVAVYSIETEGNSIVLRDKNGHPAWGGTKYGGGRNRVSVEVSIDTESLENVPEL
jgi:hypothetical protein